MTRDIIATHDLWVTSGPANFASAHAVDCRESPISAMDSRVAPCKHDAIHRTGMGGHLDADWGGRVLASRCVCRLVYQNLHILIFDFIAFFKIHSNLFSCDMSTLLEDTAIRQMVKVETGFGQKKAPRKEEPPRTTTVLSIQHHKQALLLQP